MKWTYGDADVGDIVRVKLGSIYHYGIYAENDNVIQFGLPPTRDRVASDVKVLSAPANDFLVGGFMEVGEPEGGEKKCARSREQTYLCAKSRIGEGGYDLLHNNCEHFAYECMFGTKYCSQVSDIRKKLRELPVADVYVARFPFDTENDEIFPQARRDEIEKCTGHVRAQKYYVWKLLEYALMRTFGLKMNALSIKNKRGKWVSDEASFSVSHCEDSVAVAVSRKDVGVDIERVSPERFDSRMREQMLTDGERANIACDEQAARERANLLWTVKEAEFKRAGGKNFVPNKIDCGVVACKSALVISEDASYYLTVASEYAEHAVFRVYGGQAAVRELDKIGSI